MLAAQILDRLVSVGEPALRFGEFAESVRVARLFCTVSRRAVHRVAMGVGQNGSDQLKGAVQFGRIDQEDAPLGFTRRAELPFEMARNAAPCRSPCRLGHFVRHRVAPRLATCRSAVRRAPRDTGSEGTDGIIAR